MIRIIIAIIYLSIGMAVVSVETKERPTLPLDGNSAAIMVVLWPMFPIQRAYREWVGEGAACSEVCELQP